MSAVSTAATAPARKRRRRRARRRALVITVAAALGAAVTGAGVAVALWASEDTFLGGLVTAGDLEIQTGAPTWRQVTPGVDQPASGGLADISTFVTMPGDVIRITQPVTTFLLGENLVGAFEVQVDDVTALARQTADGRVALSFHVEDQAGRQVAPLSGEAVLGELLPVPGLLGSDQGVTQDWQVVVTASIGGDYTWSDAATSELWDLGDIVVALRQVRG